MKKIVCFIAQFPPPVHGLSKAVQVLYSSRLSDKYDFRKVNLTKNLYFPLNLLRLVFEKYDLYYFTISQSILGNIRDLLILAVLALKKKRVLLHLHGNLYRDLYNKQMGGLLRSINKLLLNKAQSLIVLSESLKCIFEGIVPSEKIKVVHNFIESKVCLSEKEFLSKEENNGYIDRFNVIFLSNLILEKGYLEVLKLAKLFQDKGLDICKFYFAGNFFNIKDKKIFYEFIENNKLQQSVQYIGFVEDDVKRKLLQSATIFILPTIYPKEGQPISIIEAMVNGIVVISTKWGGIPDLIRDQETGFLVEYDDHERMMEIILNLYKERKLIKEISRKGREFIYQSFLESHYIENMDNLFEEALIAQK